MDRKLIYLIVLLVLAVGLTIVSLVEIIRVGQFNMAIFDAQTQVVCETWIQLHPLTFVSLKITLFMASIQLSLFALTTIANWKEMTYCKCLIYFLPIYALAQLTATVMFLVSEKAYTQPMMAYYLTDPSQCQSFECLVGPAFKKVWSDTMIYLIVYLVFLIAYWVIFFLRMKLFDKPENEVEVRRTQHEELHGKKVVDTDLSIDNVSQLYM